MREISSQADKQDKRRRGGRGQGGRERRRGKSYVSGIKYGEKCTAGGFGK